MDKKHKKILAVCLLIIIFIILFFVFVHFKKELNSELNTTPKNLLPSTNKIKIDENSENEILTSGEIISFVCRWQHPKTGLIPTEIAINNILNPKRDFASTYVLAVCQQILWMSNLKQESSLLSETVRQLFLKGDLSNTIDVQTGLNKDFFISVGPNAYWGISFLREYQSTNDTKWLQAAEKTALFLLELQDNDGGIVKDPNVQSAEHRVKSTEENLVSYAFFNFLFELTGNENYFNARNDILKWLVESGVYNKDKGYFTVGSFDNKVDQIYSVDVNALAIIILNPSLLNNQDKPYIFGGKNTTLKIVDSFETARVSVDYKHPTGKIIKDISAFDFTNKFNRPGREATVSPEFSSQVALSYMVISEYYLNNNDKKAALKYIGLTQNILTELTKIAYVNNKAASLPYATHSGIRRFSFDNWYITKPEANISSSWIAFALKGFNPYSMNGFEIGETLKPYAPWLNNPGEIISSPKEIKLADTQKMTSEIILQIDDQASREKDFKKPVVYYKSIYNKSKESVEIARKVLEANMMTSFSCWIGGLIDKSKQDYDTIGLSADGQIIKKKLTELPEKTSQALLEEYLYFEPQSQIQWRLAPRYNLNIDFSKGSYYAFQYDENYNIIQQYKNESDVPKINRADLKSLEKQYQSTEGLPSGHKILRYFYALEVDKNYNIKNTYNSIDDLPGLASKVPIDYKTYQALIDADENQRQIFRRSGYLTDNEGNLATCEYGKYYYGRILALDTSRYLTIKTYSRITGNEIVGGTRSLLADWEIDEKAKLNALKYEEGLIEGMVMRTPLIENKDNLSQTEPVWIYVGQRAVKEEEKEFKQQLHNLLMQINNEKDAIERQKLIIEFDRMRWESSWRDENDVLHLMFYGLKAAKDNLAELEKAKERADLSYRVYDSILGYNEDGNDLRDTFGRVWLKVVNENTQKILHVEVYDIAGNLQFLLAGDITIDPLFKTVTAEIRTDVIYDEATGQMLGSHSYYIDEAGDWVADISEGIFRGYTSDKNHFIIERRIFKKDNYGNILYKNNEPLYSKKIEYYAPEGDLAAQISGNTLTVISYEGSNEIVRNIYILDKQYNIQGENIELSTLIEGRVWVRSIRPTGEIIEFKDIIINALTSVDPSKRKQVAENILNMLGAEEIERISDSLLLEKSIVSNNLSGQEIANDSSSYYMYFEPGDYLGREKIKIQSKTIRIPVSWIPRTQIAAKTLNFDFAGELVSISETLPYQKAETLIPPEDLPKFKVLAVEADTLLPITQEKIYRLITHEDGSTHISNIIDTIRLGCLMPDDMLGRELASVEFSMTWNETKLHPESEITIRRNIFGRRELVEIWQEEGSVKRSRIIGKEKETLINEWYKQDLNLGQLQTALIQDVITKSKFAKKEIPENYKELMHSLRIGKIKSRNLLVKPQDLKFALDTIKQPPYGVLPGYHILKANGKKGEIKYFAGLVEYPRSDFHHKGINITYEKQIPEFRLPAGANIKGFKYGALNSSDVIYDVHTLNGQLILRERPYIQVRLINMYPIESASTQTEYYNPLVPYSYQSPIMIKRYFRAGKQPADEKPGLLIVGYFKNQATVYLPNGWQVQELIERRPLDINHWILSELFYDTSGQLKYKKQHIESKPIYYIKALGLKRPFFIIAGIVLFYISLCKIFDKKLQRRKHETFTNVFLMTDSHLIKKEIQELSALLPNNEELLASLELEYSRVISNLKTPDALIEICNKIYRPLLIKAFNRLGRNATDYSAAMKILLNRITRLAGKSIINLKHLYPEEIIEFENWSKLYGSRLTLVDSKLYINGSCAELSLFDSKITMFVLFRMIFDESKDFKATVPSVRYYIFDKCINLLIKHKENEIHAEIISDVSALSKALEIGYKHNPELSKENILTYEDIEGLFTGKKKEFIATFLSLSGKDANEKLIYLASINGRLSNPNVKDHHSYLWLKTYDDEQGLKRFIRNLKPLWLPLTPLFVTVLIAGILMGLKISLLPFNFSFMQHILGFILPPIKTTSAIHMRILFQNIFFLIAGIGISAVLIKYYLGNKDMQINKKTSLKCFWLLYVLAVFVWGIFSIFIISWTASVVYKASYERIGWMLFINGSASLLSFVFVIASFYSLFYALISFLGFLQGKIEGVGQIRSWSSIRKNIIKSKQRFIDIMSFSKQLQNINYNELWNMFFNCMLDDLYNDYKLNLEEKERLSCSQDCDIPNLSLPPLNAEAQQRIEKYINSWLMDIPPALCWHQLPSLSIMVTAFNEAVAFSFDDINVAEWGARETKLNHLISRYNDEWVEFVNRLSDDEFERWLEREKLLNLSGLQKLPEGLPSKIREKIRHWANKHAQPIEKTIREVCKIKECFKIYARFCYPQASEEEIETTVTEKLQIILNYEGFHKNSTRNYDRAFILRLLKEYPFLQAYWNEAEKDYKLDDEIYNVDYKKGTDGGLHQYNPKNEQIELIEIAPIINPVKKGKPSGFNQALSFIKGDTILFFDANASVRMEDALKIPMALGEFYKDDKLAEVLFSEFIYTHKYSWIAEAIKFNEETFTSVTQRTLNLFDACGFYGHSAIIRTGVITACGGIPQDYVSEDILMSTRFWLKGYKSTHKEYLMFGKGRETSFYSALVPFSKWSIGSSNLALGRIQIEILDSTVLHYAQKIMLMFGFSFFYHIPLVLFINLLYLWLVICWGVNAFMTVPFPFLFAIFGLLFNQSITTMGVVYLVENYRPQKVITEYFKLVGKNYLLYTAAIPSYALGFIKGLKGKLKIAISSKGWNLQHVSLKDIWGDYRTILSSITIATVIGIPLLFALVEIKLIPFIISPFIAFIPLALSILLYFIGTLGSRFNLRSFCRLRDELVPDGDLEKASAVKLQIIYAIGLIAFLAVGFIMWGIIFSSFASKLLFILSILYISPPLSYVLIPILANSQPFAVFKEWTSSHLWNYIFIPLITISCFIGTLVITFHISSIKAESFVYLGLAIIFLTQWFLLKWKLSGYEYLKNWSTSNLKHLKSCNIALRSKIEDNIYFAHQQLLELDVNKKFVRIINKLLAGVFVLCAFTFLLYVLNEFKIGFYRPWFWAFTACGILIIEVMGILITSRERKLLKGFLSSISSSDLHEFFSNQEYIDKIWQKLPLFYRNNLVRTYDEDERAKKYLSNYIYSYFH
jgi:hypothetical protein